MKTSTTKVKQYIDKNPIEAVRESDNISGALAKSLKQDFLKGAMRDFWSQVVSVGATERSNLENLGGDLEPGQEISLAAFKNENREERKETPAIEAGIDYKREVLHGARMIEQKENQKTNSLLEQIQAELRQLTSASKELQAEFKEVTTEQRIAKPGKYHVSLFQWILTAVRQAKMKVEDSKLWLATTKSKHAKKGFYWANADEKVGGTSFSLSSERVVATQTG